MMNKDFIKKQIEVSGLNISNLKNITGVGYATLNDYINKPEYKISAKHYTNIIDTLFTPFEQLLYANASLKAIGNNYDYLYWYEELRRRKIANSDNMEVSLSGAPQSDEKEIVRVLPAHVIVAFNDIEGKNSIRIFDSNLYSNINNKGQKDRIQLIKQFYNIQ
ncbi:hypothetical protein O0K60_07650 [Staphylococcus pseudintermedius]|nr:hypothetical protein [Staphylococcus pseudintermedius]EHT8097012.1 hypothetical protein [Staphylococcus pseudintermedius]EII2683342.1 hypothetical protein [Staphylococcus pseudintermedius]EIO0097079.1 hypothetical protein [Staphylococcus pseudintermedius]EKC6433810.1 hypothetical protein [Staphylococcus pseudintermedius]EKH2151564.1 hypothetical protein [Staphylococcus pseudintermedius]